MVVLVTAVRRANCQSFVDGGEVAVECSSCNCKGDSEDGSVVVFDNPSTGSRVSLTHVLNSFIGLCRREEGGMGLKHRRRRNNSSKRGRKSKKHTNQHVRT